jgi:hypothetical protein
MQVTLLRWPIASCYRTFGHRKLESLVSIPHPSFADQSADDASANVPNISQVTFLSWPIASRYRCLLLMNLKFWVISFLGPSFADQSADDTSANVPNASQVTFLF